MFHPPYHVYFVLVATILSILFNGILLVVVFFRSTTSIGRYKILIMIFAIFNIVYSLVHLVMEPVIHVYDMTFMECSTKALTVLGGRITSAIFASCFAQSLVLFALHYFYRYIYAVKPDYKWIFAKKKPILIMIFLYLFVAIDYGSVCFFNFAKTPIKDEYWREEFLSSYGVNITDVGYISAIYYFDGSFQISDLIGLANVSLVIGSTLTVLVYCAITVWKTIGKMKIVSGKVKSQQTKLFTVLLMQTVLSLVFTFIPSSLVLVTAMFVGRYVGHRANIISLLLTIFSVIDPLLLLYFVGCYRNAIKAAFGCKHAVEPQPATSVSLRTRKTSRVKGTIIPPRS